MSSFSRSKMSSIESRTKPTTGTFSPRSPAERILEEDRISRAEHKEAHKMAPYRIQIQFGSRRTTRGANAAQIRVWESAGRLTGDGDVTMSFCGNPECVLPFSGRLFQGDIVTCPHCLGMYTKDQCGASLTPQGQSMQNICIVMERIFLSLRGEADVVSLWIKEDIRSISGTTSMDTYYEHKQTSWERVVYPYYNIIKDTISGDHTIYNRLMDFLA